MRFLESFLQFDTSKDTIYSKVDQLPPLNMSLLFSNEYGFASYQRLLGVRFVMDGSVYSTQDMYTERQITWVASDLTPLLPLTLSSLYQNRRSRVSCGTAECVSTDPVIRAWVAMPTPEVTAGFASRSQRSSRP